MVADRFSTLSILHAGVPSEGVRTRLRALGIDRNTTPPPYSVIEKDRNGNPTGMLIAKPNATILYASIASGPILGLDDQINSTRHYMREMNRLGITSVIDAGGGEKAVAGE